MRTLVEMAMLPAPASSYTTADLPSPPLEFIEGVPCLRLEPVVESIRHKVVLFFHGNESDLGTVWRTMGAVATRIGAVVYAMEYQGYGIHVGPGMEATEEKITIDARRVLRALRKRHAGRKIHLMGHSIGTGVTAALAREDAYKHVGSITLVAPFENIHAMSSRLMGRFAGMFTSDEYSPFDTKRNLAEVPKSIPLLIVHGTDDTVIPVEHSKELKRLHPHANLVVVPAMNHGHVWIETTLDAIRKNIKS